MSEYTLIWTEENHNYYDIGSALFNAGIKAEKRFGSGIRDGFIFVKGFHAEFYLEKKDLKRVSDEGYKFFISKKRLKYFLFETEKSKKELTERVKALVNIDLSKMSGKELLDFYGFFGWKLGSLFVCYSMTHPYRVKKLEDELTRSLQKIGVKNVSDFIPILTTPKEKYEFLKSADVFFKSFGETIEKENAKINLNLVDKPLARKKKSNLR